MRTACAARQRVLQADQALLMFEIAGSKLKLSSRTREVWLEVLRARVEHEEASLRDLGAAMRPPMTKDRYSAILRRACKFASSVDSRNERPAVPVSARCARQDRSISRRRETPGSRSVIAELIEAASHNHGGASGRRLAAIASHAGYGISTRTLNHLWSCPDSTPRPGAGVASVRAIAYLAQVPEDTVYLAAGVRSPAAPGYVSSVAAMHTATTNDAFGKLAEQMRRNTRRQLAG